MSEGEPKLARIAAATLGGILACGIPLWPIPYRQVSMGGNPSWMIWLFLGALAGVGAGWLIRRGLTAPILAVTAGYVLAVTGRVVVETIRDPTSHNLWPFEVLIAGVIGLAGAAAGVAAARLTQRSALHR